MFGWYTNYWWIFFDVYGDQSKEKIVVWIVGNYET